MRAAERPAASGFRATWAGMLEVVFASGKLEVAGVKVEWVEFAGVFMAKLEVGTESAELEVGTLGITGLEITGLEGFTTFTFEVAVLTASKNATKLV